MSKARSIAPGLSYFGALPRLGVVLLSSLVFSGIFLHSAYDLYLLLQPTPASDTALTQAPKISPAEQLKIIQSAKLFGDTSGDSNDFGAIDSSAFALRGTFVGFKDATSYAIIASNGQTEKRYRVGDILTGDMQIVEIYADHVVTSNGTAQMILNLPDTQ